MKLLLPLAVLLAGAGALLVGVDDDREVRSTDGVAAAALALAATAERPVEAELVGGGVEIV